MSCRLFVAHRVVLSGVQLLSVTVNRETCCLCRCLLLGLESVVHLLSITGNRQVVYQFVCYPFFFAGLIAGTVLLQKF